MTVMSTPSVRPGPARQTRRPLSGQPRQRHDTSLIGRLNREWAQLKTTSTPARWRAHPSLNHPTLAHIEAHNRAAGSVAANATLHALLAQHQAHDDYLAARVVFQLMLGSAVRLVSAHTGRDTREHLETVATEALWRVTTTYPLHRRPIRIAANITLDTLHSITTELAHTRHETPADPAGLDLPSADPGQPADLELLELLAWAVHTRTISAADATLIADIYSPAPGQPGGRHAAPRHGLSWPAARQRAHRAIRKITHSVRADIA